MFRTVLLEALSPTNDWPQAAGEGAWGAGLLWPVSALSSRSTSRAVRRSMMVSESRSPACLERRRSFFSEDISLCKKKA